MLPKKKMNQKNEERGKPVIFEGKSAKRSTQ